MRQVCIICSLKKIAKSCKCITQKLPYPTEPGMKKLKRFYYGYEWHKKHLKLYFKVPDCELDKWYCPIT
jgi:hypothetical protein